MSVRLLSVAAYALLCALSAGAQTATLLKDINTTTDASFSSRPGSPVPLGGRFYFSAQSGNDPVALWSSDGTEPGTERVGAFRLTGNQLVQSSGSLFFPGDSVASGHELYRLNEAGSRILVKDIYPGPANGFDGNLYSADGRVFFAGADGVTGVEPWTSDGTDAGTVLIKDIYPAGDSDPEFRANRDSVIYFTAENDSNGRELWRSDGTAAGTTLIRDIRPGPESSGIGELVRMGDSFYFQANDGSTGAELWRTDGTALGTTMVADLNPGSASGVTGFSGRVFNGLLYFAADNGDGSGSGLWVTDGTSEGTTRVLGGLLPSYLHATDSALFFTSDDADHQGEVWRSNGTTQGTMLVKKFDELKNNFATVGDSVLFPADDGGENGFELWKTDGSEPGAVLVKDIRPGGDADPTNLNVIDGVLYFSANDGEHGIELWRSDGTAQGTLLVRDIGIIVGESSPRRFARLGEELFFDADDGVHGQELWKTDGTSTGTVMVKDIAASGSSRLDELVRAGQFVYFLADDGDHGEALWRTDGTEQGTIPLTLPTPDGGIDRLGSLTQIGDLLFFVARTPDVGLELWRSNGTPEGTAVVKDIAPGVVWSNPEWLTDVDGTLFFVADDGATGRDLWRSDGTAEGTIKISPTRPRELVNVDGALFFEGFDGDDHALWKSDGAAEGTVRLTELPALGEVRFASAASGLLFFFVEFPVLQQQQPRDTELWRSDGTPAGTVAVNTFPSISPPGLNPLSASIGPIVEYGGKAYFMTGTPYTSWGLWESDGTVGGTRLVQNAELPPDSPMTIRPPYGGALFFVAVQPDSDNPKSYLGRSHGTAESTTLYEPAFESSVLNVAGLGSQVFFTGHTSEYGRELWSVSLQPSISTGGVVDAAGYLPTLAPGGLASLFGVELAGDTAAASGFPLPTTLAGAKVKVNGVDAPLLFVSPTQINFQVPYGTPTDSAVSVVAWLNGQQSLSQPTAVGEFAPALFVNPATGEPIVQRHPDGTLITAQNPAKPGDTIILYVTGIGGLDNPPPTGAAATDSPLSTSTTTPIVTIGGVEVTVLFSGLAPGFAGLGQINIALPETLQAGSPLPVTIRFGDSVSPALQLPL